MPGTFYLVGKIEPSHTGHTFKVYMLTDEGKWVFLGQVTRNALNLLTQDRIGQADICKFSSGANQEPLNFNLELSQ